MWNWLVSSLSQGATHRSLRRVALLPGQRSHVQARAGRKGHLFGTSPRYLAAVEKAGLKPGISYDLSRLKTMITTGSPLSVENYEFVYKDVKPDVFLNNISGGTEAIACFGIGNPISPIYAGKCRGSAWG